MATVSLKWATQVEVKIQTTFDQLMTGHLPCMVKHSERRRREYSTCINNSSPSTPWVHLRTKLYLQLIVDVLIICLLQQVTSIFFYNFCIFIKNCFRHLKDLFPKTIQNYTIFKHLWNILKSTSCLTHKYKDSSKLF